jgi:inosine-uridine nucleoside N-ribohydrolase
VHRRTPTPERGRGRVKVIYDTDIGWMNDDCIAAVMALCSADIELLGITPVMGNYDLRHEVACALRLLEVTGREDVPVCPGFDRPLLHERSRYADAMWGQWATFAENIDLPAGLPMLKPDRRHACDFIVEAVRANPGEVTILAVGPLTNLAVAIRRAPDIVGLVRQVIIMGGGIGLYPGGWGNSTPLSEFNFWVDPEAARIVLRSSMPTVLVPINVCRKTYLPKGFVETIAGSPTAKCGVAELFRTWTMPLFDSRVRENHLSYGLYDSCVVGYALRPDLFKSKELCVDVITLPGPQYGMSIAYEAGERLVDDENIRFPIDDPPPPVTVVHDVDFDGLVSLYLETVGARPSRLRP